MPAFYALTSPKLFGIIQRVLLDEKRSAHVLSDLYKYIWALRHDPTLKPTLNTLVLFAQRFALDYKLADEQIARVSSLKPHTPMNMSGISNSELDLLSRICSNSQGAESEPCYDPLTKDAVHARLGVPISSESQS